MPITVLIADESSIVRQGLKTFLEKDCELQVVATVASEAEAIEFTRELNPNIVLIELFEPKSITFGAIQSIRQENQAVVILVIANSWENWQVGKALQAGANGFLLKNMEEVAFCNAVKSASIYYVTMALEVVQILSVPQHETIINRPKTPKAKLQAFPEQKVAEKVTEREQEVLQMMAEGKTNKEIGYQLGLSEKTIKVQVSIILAKLGSQSRTQAALRAAQLNLIKLNE